MVGAVSARPVDVHAAGHLLDGLRLLAHVVLKQHLLQVKHRLLVLDGLANLNNGGPRVLRVRLLTV